MFGGGVFRPSSGIIVIAVLGTAMLAAVLAYATPPRNLPAAALILLASLILLPVAQLIPLPPALWSALPGRNVAAQVLTVVEGAMPWRPATLSVTGTLGALLCFTWLVSLLISILSMTEANVRRMMLLILALGVVDIAVGAVQFMSRGTVFNFYNNNTRQFLLGFFANKNHSGLFLASMLLIGIALAPRGKALRREAMVWMVPAGLAVMVAIVATYSRAGLLLGLLALAIIAAIIRAETKRTSPTLLLGLGGAGLAIIAMLSTAVGERAVARFGLVENDLRWLFWRGSWPLAKEFFPFGAGFGTFEHLFATDERLEWVKPTYVNNAHNDYLEAIIEAGLPAAILIGLALFVIVRAIPPAWRARHDLAGRWALSGVGITVLFAVHSLGDYPLRRLGPAALFFFAFALVLRLFVRNDEVVPRAGGPTSRVGSDRAAAIQE
jgi:O-antigen ligase